MISNKEIKDNGWEDEYGDRKWWIELSSNTTATVDWNIIHVWDDEGFSISFDSSLLESLVDLRDRYENEFFEDDRRKALEKLTAHDKAVLGLG